MGDSAQPTSPKTTAEGRHYDWIDLDYDQAKFFTAWNIPKQLWRNLEEKLDNDAEVYCDHSTYYREEELYLVSRAWGGILSGPSWNRFVSWWHYNYRHNVQGDYDEDAKMRRGFSITKFFENETWDWIHTISYGCTKFVHPSEDVNYRQLNYLILQVCLYYKYYNPDDSWESPLLFHLARNEPLPTTREGQDIAPAEPGQLSNQKVIDNMGNCGMANYDTMEAIWKQESRTTTVEVTHQSLEQVKLSIRAGDEPPKSSRRSRL